MESVPLLIEKSIQQNQWLTILTHMMTMTMSNGLLMTGIRLSVKHEQTGSSNSACRNIQRLRRPMNYDYSFLENFGIKKRTLSGLRANLSYSGPLIDLYVTEEQASKHYEIIFKPNDVNEYLFTTPTIVRGYGAYFKGGQSIQPLEASLKTKLPEDFVQFYERFGESAIITRSLPIVIYPLQQIIDDFEDDPDIDIAEGRFFRFARYQDLLYLGLRRNEETDEWQVVLCTYGLLYSEMIGPQGRGCIVAPSFYAWLKHLVETDGYPDLIYPHGGNMDYLTILEE
jgi:hypothetical protein